MNKHKSQQENKSSFASKPQNSKNHQTKVLLPENEDVKCTRKYGNPKMVKFGT
jgi:hypothetical protein